MLRSPTLRRWLPVLGTAIPLVILPIAILSIPLAAAQEMGLSEAETSSWILAVYGPPSLLGLVLAIRYRQPLLLTGNVFVLIFIASLGGRLSYPELVGASIGSGSAAIRGRGNDKRDQSNGFDIGAIAGLAGIEHGIGEVLCARGGGSDRADPSPPGLDRPGDAHPLPHDQTGTDAEYGLPESDLTSILTGDAHGRSAAGQP
jgi:hypothetical protein